MNEKWLKSFIKVHDTGSVSKAAESLYISPQALQQQINLLEREVGALLLVRSSRGVIPTVAGKEFYAGAKKILETYDEILSKCRHANEANRKVRIPMMNTIIVPELMEKVCKRFDDENPDGLKTEFVFDTDFDKWLDGLLSYRYDIIEFYTLDGLCPEGVHFEYLDDVPTFLVMSPYHSLADRDILTLNDLKGHTLLSPKANEKLSGYMRMYIEGNRLDIKVETVGNNRYEVIAGLGRGCIYTADYNISQTFPGYISKPLDFDTHVQHGFACRDDSFDKYKLFFDNVHIIMSNTES